MVDKTKLRKMRIIVMVLVLFLVVPLVSAINIQDFLVDMEANPGNYYIWHDRTDPEMVTKIQDFADSFGNSPMR